MNPYIEFPGEQSLRPPGVFADTRFFYFILPADQDRLRSLCQRYLRSGSGEGPAYEPLGVVLLAFTHVTDLTSGDPQRGTITYKDIAFWVPVWGGKVRPLCLFPVFIFVDDCTTMVTGREIFGFPKQFGRFKMPLRFDELAGAPSPAFSADVIGTQAPGGVNDWLNLLTISQITKKDTDDQNAFFAALGRLVLPKALRTFTVPDWLSHLTSIGAVGLKQFRDASSPASACYQAIVEAPLSTEKIFGRPRFLFDAFELTTQKVFSHPIQDVLGLQQSPQRVPVAIYLEATTRLDDGVVVWRGA